MYIKDIYITFIKKHWKYYIFYFLSFISIPINQVVVPHYYGKIIELLKGKNIEKAGKFLAKLPNLGSNSRIKLYTSIG